MRPQPVYEFYRDGLRHTRNEQCPAMLKSKLGYRCENRARYLIGPDPDGLWLTCGVHRTADSAGLAGR